MRYVIAFLSGCLCSCVLFAQPDLSNCVFTHLTDVDDLLSNVATNVLQDSKGFIWISSNAGIQRYDGSRFISYNDKLFLPEENNYQTRILDIDRQADGSEKILVVKSGAYYKWMDLRTMRVTDVSKQSLLQASFFRCHTVLGSEDWIVTDKHLYIFHGNLPVSVIIAATDKQSRQTWARVKDYLVQIDNATGKVYTPENNPLHLPLLQFMKNRGVADVLLDSRRNLWISTHTDTLYRYNMQTQKISIYTNISFPHSRSANHINNLTIFCMYEDSRHHLWLGATGKGLLQYLPEKDSFAQVSGLNNSSVIFNNEIHNIFQDRDENIWVSTDKGISVFNPYHIGYNITGQTKTGESLFKAEITGFTETAKKEIWVTTWGNGILIFDSLLQYKKHIIFPNTNPNKNLVWDVLEDNTGCIWAGCQSGMVHIFKRGSYQPETLNPPEFGGSAVICMQKDKQGNIIFGLQGGAIAMWDCRKNIFIPCADSSFLIKNKPLYISTIYVNDDGNRCRVATSKGLYEFDLHLHAYTGKFTSPSKLPNVCFSISPYNDSLLLTGFLNKGLFLLNKKNDSLYPFFNNGNTFSQSVHGIYKDAQGNVWFTSNYSLYKFDATQNKLIPFQIKQGSLNSEFLNKFYTLHSGKYITFTSTELFSFYPDSLLNANKRIPYASITGLRIFDQPLDDSLIAGNSSPIMLNYRQNFITLQFASFIYPNDDPAKYKYRLQGIDPGWVETNNYANASYTNLSPGKYSFYAMVSGQQEKPAVITFIIQPPFWQTWWFRTFYIGTLLALCWWAIRARIKHIQLNSLLKQQIAETEMRALQAQMNPHFIFNCLNAIDNLIQTNQKNKASVYLTRFAKLIRSILNSAQHNEVPFEADMESLKLYLQMEQLRCSNSFEYSFSVDEKLLQDCYTVLPMGIQPFLENAINHGLMHKKEGEKKLQITIQSIGNDILYTITDTGIGREAAGVINRHNKPEHISSGIRIAIDRINLYNHSEQSDSVRITDITDNNNRVTGTCVEVRIATSV
ncbi:MAG: histidine kinase [Chitinophagaceae bacterium]|jgi:ligand-binding sensor domain-containing protein|nr:histidine kinase [Chitinophagaceae bacterium]